MVGHGPKPGDGATPYRPLIRGDGGHDLAGAQQTGRNVLVLPPDVQRDVALRHRCQRRQHPTFETVSVHDDADVDDSLLPLGRDEMNGLLLRQGDLLGQTQKQLPCFGGLHGLGPPYHDVAHLVFERLDALAHRRLRDTQLVGGTIEAAGLDDLLQGHQLFQRHRTNRPRQGGHGDR